jgi:hypothetical protein
MRFYLILTVALVAFLLLTGCGADRCRAGYLSAYPLNCG